MQVPSQHWTKAFGSRGCLAAPPARPAAHTDASLSRHSSSPGLAKPPTANTLLPAPHPIANASANCSGTHTCPAHALRAPRRHRQPQHSLAQTHAVEAASP